MVKSQIALAWRPQLAPLLLKHPGLVDAIEVPVNMYLYQLYRQSCDPDLALLRHASTHFDCLSHGPWLSIGSFDQSRHGDRLRALAGLVRDQGLKTFSEHLCFTETNDELLGEFITLPFTEQAVARVVSSIRTIRRTLGVPVLVENVTQHFTFPNSTMSEGEFFRRVCEGADCGMLLDVANAAINGSNLGTDPIRFVDELPRDRIAQVHFCGATDVNGYLLDTHQEATSPMVWSVLDHVLGITAASCLIYERDSRFHALSEVLNDIWVAREKLASRSRKPSTKLKVTLHRPERAARSTVWADACPLDDLQRCLGLALRDPAAEAAVYRNEFELFEPYSAHSRTAVAVLRAIPPPQLARAARHVRAHRVESLQFGWPPASKFATAMSV